MTCKRVSHSQTLKILSERSIGKIYVNSFEWTSLETILKQTSDFTHPRRYLCLQHSFDILCCIHSCSYLLRFCKLSFQNKALFSCIHRHLWVEKVQLKRDFYHYLVTKSLKNGFYIQSYTEILSLNTYKEVLNKFL